MQNCEKAVQVSPGSIICVGISSRAITAFPDVRKSNSFDDFSRFIDDLRTRRLQVKPVRHPPVGIDSSEEKSEDGRGKRHKQRFEREESMSRTENRRARALPIFRQCTSVPSTHYTSAQRSLWPTLVRKNSLFTRALASSSTVTPRCTHPCCGSPTKPFGPQ